MQDANMVVNNTEEKTSGANSTIAETQTTSDSGNESAQSTSEVVKTQAEDGSDELVSGANAQVKSTKGINRVQELANARNAEKSAREKAEAEAANLRAILAQQAQQPQQSQYDPYVVTMYQQELRLRGLEESIQFEKAKKLLPYLDKESSMYNKNIDDLVFNTARNEGISYEEAALRMGEAIKAVQSVKQDKVAMQEAQKVGASTLPPQRSAAISEDTEVAQRFADLQKTGTRDAVVKLLQAKRRK